MRAIDLFSGMGGLSLGFRDVGFTVTGYEQSHHALNAYRANVGKAIEADLTTETPEGPADCVIGGPPCRPWSPINLQRRRADHDDYELVRAFDRAVLRVEPAVFVMENVPILRGDPKYQEVVAALEGAYEVAERVFTYADWGAATKRRRLFVVGTRRDRSLSLTSLLAKLDALRTDPQTVREAIYRFGGKVGEGDPDHEWPKLKTITKYSSKYESNQYGWYRLDWDKPAPSFGHVAKTYTLHPDGSNGTARVVSPREVMAILGFPDSYHFPTSVPRTAKYRMVADAVSPRFSRALAFAIMQTLNAPTSD